MGRIYQRTFIDTYAKVGFAKLYDVKTAITAADLLNDQVLPFLRGARHRALAGADRSRQRILRLHEVDAARRQSGATRV